MNTTAIPPCPPTGTKRKVFAMTIRHIVLVLLLTLPSVARSQDLGAVAFQQAVNDFENGMRLMCVAAHPDDEDGASLALHRYKYGVKTFAVLATKGEGGQNEIGPELYADLAVIRTEEMKAAAAIEGAELHFLNLPEFGYSKTMEETLEVWGEEETLRRMVRVIRALRPHVIITHHGRMKDHGHHQAIGWAVQEAFDLAADPKKFLEDGLEPWQTLRLYIRDFTGQSESAAVLDISALDDLRGKTYTEIAADALRVHKSQGMEYFIERLLDGQPKAYYDLVKSAPGDASIPPLGDDIGPLFDGLNVPLSPLDMAQGSAAGVLSALQKVNNPGATKLEMMMRQFRFEIFPEDAVMTPGQSATVRVEFRDFGEAEAAKVRLNNGTLLTPDENGAVEAELPFTLPEDEPLTLPKRDHVFEQNYQAPQIHIPYTITPVDGTKALSGTLDARVEVAPEVDVDFLDAPYLWIRGRTEAQSVDIRMRNNKNGAADVSWSVTPPKGWTASAPWGLLQFAKEDEEQVRSLVFEAPDDVPVGDYEFTIETPGKTHVSHIRVADMVIPAKKNVGVIQSYDDTFLRTLERLGVPHAAITDRDFGADRLDAFDTIIVDIRAYRYRPDLAANNRAVLDWVSRGGTLLVQYQKTFDWLPEFAPYPIQLSRNRVTREDAAMTILQPEHPIFTTPNVIQPEDWEGWIQERGLYFPDKWDDAYTSLIACHDPGEIIPPGSLLVAGYGAGKYVYTALGWYRQLRELHPGALRVFANMLAL